MESERRREEPPERKREAKQKEKEGDEYWLELRRKLGMKTQ